MKFPALDTSTLDEVNFNVELICWLQQNVNYFHSLKAKNDDNDCYLFLIELENQLFHNKIRRQKIELCVYLLHFQDPKGKKYCDFLAGKLTEIPSKCR